MRTLDWFERDLWLQRLQSCYPVHAKQTVKIYPFPMDEVLFQILKRAKLEEPWDLCSQLQRLREHYCREHPEFTATIEELTTSGWLDNFCGRWSLVGAVRQEHVDSVEDEDLREILQFLSWLQENIPDEQSAVYLENWDGTLAELRGRCPEVPDTDWFIQQQILCEDRKHLCRLPYTLDRHHVHLALARLLLDCRTAEEQAQWAEIAHQLKATEKLMNYIPRERQSEVVALMADRVLTGTHPDAGEESRRIWRQEMLERRCISSEIVEADILSEDDSIQNLTRAEQAYWERFPWFWHRNIWRAFELSIVTRHIRRVPVDKLDAVLARLERLHNLGMLELYELPPEACLELLRYSQTQFLSIQFLAKLHREQSHKGGNGAGDCILAWISFALRQPCPLEGAPIARLLLYLAEYAFPGTRRNRPDTRLLQAVLWELSMFCCSKTDLLTAVTEQIIQAMDTSTGVTWCRRFQLLCSWADQLYQNMPEDQRADSPLLELLYDSLEQGLDMLLNKPFCKEAAYIPSSLFEQSYWPELYERMGQKDRRRMRECVMCWYRGKTPSHQEQFDARYQFRLGLGWLTALVRSLEDDKQVIQAFGSLLLYVLEKKNQLLTIEYHNSAAEHGALERAIHVLRRDWSDMAPLLGRLRTLRVAELVLLIQYSGDEATRAFFLEALEKKVQNEQNCMNRFGWDKLVGYVLDQKIQSLYPICEARLEEHLAYGREHNLHHPVFDLDQQQLSYLWLLQGDCERVLSEGHPYVKAIVYLEEGPHQNLSLAAASWKFLAEKDQESSAYLNWMLAYLYQLKRTPQENSEGRRSLYRQIEELRQTIERGPFLNWDEDAQLHYAGELIAIWAEQGMDEDQAIRLAAQTLSIPEEKISERWKDKEHDEPEVPTRLAPTPAATNEQLAQMLLRFHNLPLERKSMVYFDGGLAASSEQYTTALVLLEVFRTLYHLSNFGDKLLFGETLDEDHCTQLFREMFNLNGGEWWRLAANDQQQSGSTGKVSKKQLHRSAENDLLIKADNYTCMILEAMVLTGWDQNSVERHLLKLIGDNIHNAPMALLVYGNSTAPWTLWERLNKYLLDSFPVSAEKQGVSLSPFAAFSGSEFYLPDPYTSLRELTRHSVIAHVRHGGMDGQPLVVIFADIGKRAHTGISLAARNGGQP